MTIKQQGGIFGRNPTFNNVDVEGTLTVNGEPISDFGTMAQQDADNVNIDGGSVTGLSEVGVNTLDPVYSLCINNPRDNLTLPNFDGIAIKNGGYLDTTSRAGLHIEAGFGDGNQDLGFALYAKKASAAGNTGNDFVISQVQRTSGIETPRALFRHDGNFWLYNNLKIVNAGNGIDFSATSGTGTSELFDDYEEGTWTPSVSSGSGVITTVGTVSGFYTKIGRVVNVIFNVAITDNGTGSGFIVLTGIPFVPSASAVYAGSGVNSSTAKSLSVTTVNASSQTYVRLYDGTYPVASGQTLRGNVIYIV